MEWLLSMIPALIVVAIGVLIYLCAKRSPDTQAEDGSPMPAASLRLLIYYLLLFGSCLVYMVISLNSVDLPEATVLPEAALSLDRSSVIVGQKQNPEQINAVAPDNSIPILLQVFPHLTTGNTLSVALALYGRNFKNDSKVRFNMRERQFIQYIDADLIRAQLELAELVGTGSITVDVVNPGNKASNAIMVPIAKPRVHLNVFGWQPLITREAQLLLLAVFAGALGSYVHAIKSLADFIGNRTLTASWFWWYIARPFLGMAMALIFYAVLRGGFLTGTPADARLINPFGVIAVAALVGMFADKAAQKLGEVFDTLFKSEDTRGGKLSAPVIDKLDPDTIFSGQDQPIMIKIIGDRLGKVSGVRLNGDERKPETVSEKEVTFKLRPEDMTNPAEIKITLVNPDGAVSTAATLHVTNLAITTPTPLPNGMVATDYSQQLTASGGSTPYKWSLVNPHVWLKINEQSGVLSGKPTTASTSKVTVKNTDKSGAAVTKTYDLTVDQSPTVNTAF